MTAFRAKVTVPPQGGGGSRGGDCRGGGGQGGHTDMLECTRCPATHSYTQTLIIPPKHNNWPPICDAKAPVTAF